MRKFFKRVIDAFVILKSKNYIVYIPVSEKGSSAGKFENISNIHVITYDIDMSLIYNLWKWHLNFLTNGDLELSLVNKKTEIKKDRG